MPNGCLLEEIINKLLREELNYNVAELRSHHSFLEKNSSLWLQFTIITLRENMHLSFDKLSCNERFEIGPFARWILSIGNNDLHDLHLFKKISSGILLHASIDPITTIVSTIYQCIG